jgi:aminodeoxyfutalosine synthase
MESLTTIGSLAEQVSRGEPITLADARVVLESHDLITIGMMGDDVRRRRHGTRTTFVRVFEVHADAVPAALPDGTDAGELRILGAPASIEAAVAAVRAARALAAGLPLTGFSVASLAPLALPDRSFAALCRELRSAGLDAIAETAVGEDDPQQLSARIAGARSAGLAVERLTVERLPADRRVDVLAAARAVQEAAGGFVAFAPLPRAIPAAEPTTGYDDVKQIALARLVVDVPSIQVDWTLYGPKLAQVALTVGADDVDRVAAVDPGTLGARRSAIEEIRRNIKAAALEPIERNGRFGVIQ